MVTNHGTQWQQRPSDTQLEPLQQALGRTFGNLKLLRLACRHPSCGVCPLPPPTLHRRMGSRPLPLALALHCSAASRSSLSNQMRLGLHLPDDFCDMLYSACPAQRQLGDRLP